MAFYKNVSAGVQEAWLSFTDTEGFSIGNTTSTLSAGSTRGSYKFVGIQQMPSAVPEGEAVVVEGDDGVLGTLLFESAAPREFLINMGQGDLTLDAQLQGTTTYTEGDMILGAVDPNAPEYPTVALIVNSRSLKRDTGQTGQKAWTNFLYPAVQIQPLDRETYQGRTAASYRYKGVAQAVTNLNWGVTVNNQFTTEAATAFRTTSEYPVTMHAFTTDGSNMVITLDKTPAGTTSAKVRVYIERVLQTGYTVSTGAKTVTLAGSPATGRRGVIFYQYVP